MGFFTDLLNNLLSNDQQTENTIENDYEYADNTNLPRRDARIKNEVLMIAPRFSTTGEGIEFDENGCDWLIINNYTLPERWDEHRCRLMMIFPSGYPDVPPIGFYLNKKFALKRGTDSHFTGKAYHGAPDMQNAGWHWYCVHLQDGAWQPQIDYRKHDNLWTYFNMVRESLTNDF